MASCRRPARRPTWTSRKCGTLAKENSRRSRFTSIRRPGKPSWRVDRPKQEIGSAGRPVTEVDPPAKHRPEGLQGEAREGTVMTDDGVRLYYRQVGMGSDVIVVPVRPGCRPTSIDWLVQLNPVPPRQEPFMTARAAGMRERVDAADCHTRPACSHPRASRRLYWPRSTSFS